MFRIKCSNLTPERNHLGFLMLLIKNVNWKPHLPSSTGKVAVYRSVYIEKLLEKIFFREAFQRDEVRFPGAVGTKDLYTACPNRKQHSRLHIVELSYMQHYISFSKISCFSLFLVHLSCLLLRTFHWLFCPSFWTLIKWLSSPSVRKSHILH